MIPDPSPPSAAAVPSRPAPRVTIVGASARAAVFSAWRAGWTALACDHYGDLDLRRVARCERIDPRRSSTLVRAVHRTPDIPWMYTGALENQPELVDRLAACRTLWGCGGEELRQVRDPLRLRAAAAAAGVAAPLVAASRSEAAERAGAIEWLEKPRAGAGGRGICRAELGHRSAPLHESVYYQERRSGEARSAVYVASRATTRLVGVTLQLVGVPWLAPSEFAWCGNIGPLATPPPEERALTELGTHLARTFELRGLFGVDYIHDSGALTAEHQIAVLEVNPRYPASVEVIELATGRSTLPLHAAACATPDAPLANWPRTSRGALVAKAIVYSDRDLTVRADLTDTAARDAFAIPSAADLPIPGTAVHAGAPLLTVFAHGASPGECLDRVRDSAERFRRRLAER